VSYSKSREFPAFFSRHSGHNVGILISLGMSFMETTAGTLEHGRSAHSCEIPSSVTIQTTHYRRILTNRIVAQHQLGMQNGALIAVPIPEEHETVGEEIQEMVNQAVKESEENGVSKSGNDATPWLLGRIKELTGGRSLVSNAALLENCALVGKQCRRLHFTVSFNADHPVFRWSNCCTISETSERVGWWRIVSQSYSFIPTDSRDFSSLNLGINLQRQNGLIQRSRLQISSRLLSRN